MIYIYRRAASDSAVELTEALNDANVPAQRTQGGLLRKPRVIERLLAGRDRLLCWGDESPLAAPHVLNGGPIQSKLRDAQILAEAGIRTISTSVQRPPARPGIKPGISIHRDNILDTVTAQAVIGELQRWINQPVPVAEEWLGRVNNHIGGHDLLQAPVAPNFYVKKESITEEYRIHMFLGKSIRAGRKMRREFRPDGRTPSHDWIRSFDAGWIIAYEEFKSSKAMRDLASRAVEALGLHFGAVDVALLATGELMVLEVNRAPGIEGGSTQAYVNAVRGWLEGANG